MTVPRSLREPFDRHPFAREAIVALAAVGALALWLQAILTAVQRYVPLSAVGPVSEYPIVTSAFLTTLIAIAAMLTFTALYRRLRAEGRTVLPTPAAPDRSVLAHAGGTALAGGLLVAAVWLVGRLAGGSLAEAIGTSYGPGANAELAAIVTGLGLFLGLPAYVLVAHVLVQRSMQRALDPRGAVTVTALTVGALGPTAVLNASLVRATVGVGIVILAVALPVVAHDRYDHRWLTAVTAVPAAILLLGLAVERLTAQPGLAGTAYVLAQVGVVGAGALAYERTESTIPSAMGYAAFVVAAEVVVFVTQVGGPF